MWADRVSCIRCTTRSGSRSGSPIRSTQNSSPPSRPRDVGCADRLPEHVGGLLQQEVPDHVAELVVHALETIDVDEQQWHGGPGPAIRSSCSPSAKNPRRFDRPVRSSTVACRWSSTWSSDRCIPVRTRVLRSSGITSTGTCWHVPLSPKAVASARSMSTTGCATTARIQHGAGVLVAVRSRFFHG